jgi:Methyltransferase domain
MGFYAQYVLPHIIDLAMRNKETARLRAAWIPRACGEVLEVGIGSGLNLPFYSSQVQRVYGMDPSLELQRMARKRVATGRISGRISSAIRRGAAATRKREYRHNRNNVDAVFHPECRKSGSADQASSQDERPVPLSRTRLFSRPSSCGLAGPAHPALEAAVT